MLIHGSLKADKNLINLVSQQGKARAGIEKKDKIKGGRNHGRYY